MPAYALSTIRQPEKIREIRGQSASPQAPDPDRDLLRLWVETWQRAGTELDEIRRREIESADTPQAIRQLFGDGPMDSTPAPTTSGLVEQQAWFARLLRRIPPRP